jgi:Uri superfamily endonuclease
MITLGIYIYTSICQKSKKQKMKRKFIVEKRAVFSFKYLYANLYRHILRLFILWRFEFDISHN